MLKLVPGRGWVKIRELSSLMLAKVVQTLDETSFIVGGSKDRNSLQTVAEMHSYQVRNGIVSNSRCADMKVSRSSHGCTINVRRNEIYVAGGYHEGVLTRSCEAYSISTD